MIRRIFRQLKLVKLPKLSQSIVELAIHSLFALFTMSLMSLQDGEDFFIYFLLCSYFFSHALFSVPNLFKKEYFNYFTTAATLSLLVFIIGVMSGGHPLNEVFPTISMVWVASGVYGGIRGFILSRIETFEYAASEKTAELQLLRSQINPHFIFNSLNIVYATALEEKSTKTAECIAKISNLIRYALDDNTRDTVSVHKEVKYIQDYIKLQLMRSSIDHDIDIHIDITEDHEIAPLLMIPFVENAFKHGINPCELSTLFLNITSNRRGVFFQLINSVDDSYFPAEFERGFGIGIKNVEKRLKLLYPRKHKLSVGRENQVFVVQMEIHQ